MKWHIGPNLSHAEYFRCLAIDEPWQRIDVGSKTSQTTNRVNLADALGSIVALTDSNRVITTEYDYEPFGATTTTGAGNKNSYKFTAREDDSTGLYCYRARYYHPAFGRFVSEDPIEYAGGDVNLYGYVEGDPILWADPLGLASLSMSSYAGVGATITIGKNPGSKWYQGYFLEFSPGVGLRSGWSFDPLGTSTGFNRSNPNPYIHAGWRADMGLAFGNFKVGQKVGKGFKGYTQTDCDDNGPVVPYTLSSDPKWSFGRGVKSPIGWQWGASLGGSFGFVNVESAFGL